MTASTTTTSSASTSSASTSSASTSSAHRWLVAVVVGAAVSACGIAPVTTTPAPPPTVAYVNPHGRPRAFGGGVCPVQGRHEHTYPPVPKAFFVDDGGAFRDTRPIRSFNGPHRWRGRMCTISRYHQHAIAAGDLDG